MFDVVPLKSRWQICIGVLNWTALMKYVVFKETFNKRTVYWFSFVFKDYYQGFRWKRNTLFLTVIALFDSYKFCPHKFSKTVWSIFIKLSDLIDINLNLIGNFLYWYSLFRFWYINVLAIFKGLDCLWNYCLTIKNIEFKFSGKLDKR